MERAGTPAEFERAVACVDYALAGVVLLAQVVALVAVFTYERPPEDPHGLALLGGVVFMSLPWAPVCFLAGRAMQRRAGWRWILQALALIPLYLLSLIVF